MFKFIWKLFNPDYVYYCPKCHRITEEYVENLPVCKCKHQLKYTDRISESARQLLEIKDQINEDE